MTATKHLLSCLCSSSWLSVWMNSLSRMNWEKIYRGSTNSRKMSIVATEVLEAQILKVLCRVALCSKYTSPLTFENFGTGDRLGMLEAKVDRMQASIDAVLEKLDSKSSLMPTMPNMGESMTALNPMQFLLKRDPAVGDGDPEGGGGMFAKLNGFSISSGIGAFGAKALPSSRESLPHFGEWEAQGGEKAVGDGEHARSLSARAGLETSSRPPGMCSL